VRKRTLAIIVAMLCMTPMSGPARAEFGTTETRGYVDRSGDTRLGGAERFWDFVSDVLMSFASYEYNARQLETSRISSSYRSQGYDRLTGDGKCCQNAMGARVGEAADNQPGS
jgi:hypothetical protein